MLVLIYASAMNLVSMFFLLEKYRHETIWSLENLNREIDSTIHESQLYLAKATTHNQLRFQYELLWSRFPVVQSSLHQDPNLNSIPGLDPMVNDVFNRVKSMDAEFNSEQELDHARLTRWISELEHDRENLTNCLVNDISAGNGRYSRATWQDLLISMTFVGLAILALLVIVGNLIYALLEEQKRQRNQIDKDSLTGLASRDFILNQLNQLCKNKTNFCIVFLDLNKFKNINDTYGHQAGDQVLIYVAHQFQTSLEKIGTVGRIGGDEFIWLIPHAEQQKITSCYNQLTQSLNQPLQFGDKQLPISLSAGAVQAASCNYTPSKVLEYGDAAMYWAKSTHHSTLVWYGEMHSVMPLPATIS
ncbi:GGDEF domain-containing protein [uncultured Thiothrix sp.]|uniref:GGDEF domain-containing protein n=1 Tax=uncultured Thiothrix sp. TaxID=223185 RepID=UPI00260DA612|nr:GGDEF domain-containing protein [uncultured Thiothrix sp.]